MNSKDVGNLGEAKVIADLISKQLGVAQVFGDNLPFDLIGISKPKYKLYKIQVKYSKVTRGTVKLRKQKWSSNTQRNYVSVYEDDDVDVYAVYVPDLDKVLYIKHDTIKHIKNSFEIRILEAKGTQQHSLRINHYSKYLEFPLDNMPE